MIRKLKAMFGITNKSPQPDLITAQVAIASQRNEAAGQRARQALEDMLERNDSLRGYKK